ncbi:WhiB family transcriptional regulator [Gordonia terrae]
MTAVGDLAPRGPDGHTAAERDHLVKKYQTANAAPPPPLSAEWDWQLNAHCRGRDTSIFFPPSSLRGSSRDDAERAAFEICRRCPVIRECREHARQHHEPHGIWGGTSARDRALTVD